jgi:hypothetical protein
LLPAFIPVRKKIIGGMDCLNRWENGTIMTFKLKVSKQLFPKYLFLNVNFYENYAESDSVTFSVAIITNSKLKSSEDWKNFLTNEVLAFKALEQKNIKVQGKDAILSKVRENNLCGYSINMIVDNNFILNIAIRYKGAFPPEKLILDYASKLQIEKYQFPSNQAPVTKDSVPAQPALN